MAAKKKQVSVKRASPKKTVVKKELTTDEPGEQVEVRVIKPVQPEILGEVELNEPSEDSSATEDDLAEETVSQEGPDEAIESRGRGKTTKRIAISALVLLLLLLGAGVAYTWYTGQSGPTQAVKPHTTAESAATTIKPTAPSADTQESAAVEFISSPVAPGGNASINVKTVATSACTISVTYNNVPANSPDLGPQTADDFGNVIWNWTVPASAPTGTWPVKVTCTRGSKSAVVQDNLVVAR